MTIRSLSSGLPLLFVLALAAAGCGGSSGSNNNSIITPQVARTSPTPSQTGLSTFAQISANFNTSMSPATLTSSSFSASSPAGPISGVVSCAGTLATFQPTVPLPANTQITVTVTTAAQSQLGQSIAAPYTWSFTTGPVNGGAVSIMNPPSGTTGVFLNQNISAVFSANMSAGSINSGTFTVGGIVGVVSYNSVTRTATFAPVTGFAPNTTYTALLGANITSSAGAPLGTAIGWTFTTGAQRSQNPVALASSSSYAALAGAGVTSVGATKISGDLGISPGTTYSGFPPGILTGTLNLNDSIAAQAQLDLLAGQLDAESRTGGVPLANALSGVTITPGLYTTMGASTLISGTVTLDAQGNTGAVFIFQIGSTLTTAANTQVVLAGGAQPTNVFWSVGTSATIGANSLFKGMILAQDSITMQNGSNNVGALLARTGTITLVDANLSH